MNKSFAAKAIDKIQHLNINDDFCAAVNEYLMREGLIAWDDDRALFWVNHPFDGWQIAVWLMPVAERFEPKKKTEAETDQPPS